MVDVNPYLNFNGTCREALEMYARVLGGEIIALHEFGDMVTEMGLSDAHRPWIMHGQLRIGDKVIMASDAPFTYAPVAGMSVQIGLDDLAEGKRVFEAMAEGGVVKMPFEPTFWAEGFGMVVDRFGTPWMINVETKAG